MADEIPEHSELKGIAFFANHASFYHGLFNEVEFLLCHIDQDRLSTTFDDNYAYQAPSSVFFRQEIDIKYEVGLWNEFIFDSPFVYNGDDNLLIEFHYNGCGDRSLYNLGWIYGGSDRVVDGFLGYETGWLRETMISFRLIYSPLTTISAQMSCVPSSGTLPFTSAMTVNLVNNVTDQARTAAGHIDLTLANGVMYENWRSGWAELAAGGMDHHSWNQRIPAYLPLLGSSEFRLVAEDVTPAPFNQPPYLASGDVSSRFCTVTGVAP